MQDRTLERAGFKVSTEYDRVILAHKGIEALMPYASAFNMAQGIKIAAVQAMRISGEETRNWRDYAALSNPTVVVPTSQLIRATRLPMKFDWSVGFDSETVLLKLAEHVFHIHFEPALKLSQALRSEGRVAKAWAGDQSRHYSASGFLHDASKPHVPRQL